MRVSEIQVEGLFGRFKHTLTFKDDERIAIMIGPNGFGKTMMLRIIDTLFNFPPNNLADLPFKHMKVTFDDKSTININNVSSTSAHTAHKDDVNISFHSGDGYVEHHYVPEMPEISRNDLTNIRRYADDFIPFIERIGSDTWVNTQSDERLSIPQLISRYSTYLAPLGLDVLLYTPDWLTSIRDSMPVRFIGVDRLVNTYIPRDLDEEIPYRRRANPVLQRTVRVYSDDIGNHVKQKLIEYGSVSQERDRTFPDRLVQEINRPSLSDSELHSRLSDIEEKRSQIVEAGLIPQDNPELSGTTLNRLEVNDSTRDVMTVYARDAQDKLSVFNELLVKVQALKRIAKARFLHKDLSIGEDGIHLSSNGSQLELEMLSSGEQHELVMIYDLLFRVERNSLILIDEPELSLHVIWQEEFLADLEEMARLSDFNALIATHSPQIINDRWDLTITLKDPEER